MGKSSPSKLQLKHIPDVVVLETIYCIQNQWTVRRVNSVFEDRGSTLVRLPVGRLSFEKKRTAHLDEIHEAFNKSIPKKLLWRKLQQLEDRRLIASYGPSSTYFAVL